MLRIERNGYPPSALLPDTFAAQLFAFRDRFTQAQNRRESTVASRGELTGTTGPALPLAEQSRRRTPPRPSTSSDRQDDSARNFPFDGTHGGFRWPGTGSSGPVSEHLTRTGPFPP